MARKPPDDLEQFQRFVKRIPHGKMVNMLCDAYWKNQLDATEIRRCFLMTKRGIPMPVIAEPPGIDHGPTTETKARRQVARRRATKSKVRPQRGCRA